jgi:multiple sugar transport system substrate-binding protein
MSGRVLLIAVLLIAGVAALFLFLTGDDRSEHVVFVTWGTPNEVQSFQRLIDHFNATRRPRYRVKLAHAEQTSYTEHLLVQAASKSLPDVIHLDRKDLPLFVHRNMLEDLTPLIEDDSTFDLDRFLPELVPDGRINGRFYAVPHNFSTLVLYYNRDHFDAAGIRYPDSTWTWDSLLAVSQRLTRRDTSGAVTRYGCFVQIVVPTLISQNGGSVLNKSLDSCIVASSAAAGAVQFDIDLSEKYHVTWNILAQNLLWDDMFVGGRLSMVTNGRWAAGLYMRSMENSSVDVAPLPRGKYRRGAAVNHMMAISAESDKKSEAWEFVKFLVSETGQRMINEDGANIPALRSIVYSDEFLHHRSTPTMNNRVFVDELRHAITWPYEQGPFLSQLTLLSEMDLAMRRILLGQASTMHALTVMQRNVNNVIGSQRRQPEPRPFIGSMLFYMTIGLAGTTLLAVWKRHRGNNNHGT